MLVDAHPLARITSARVNATSPATSPDPPPGGAPTLCLGEALVDLICERSVDSVSDGDAFVPHFGGSVATVAVVAARHGAHVSFAGGAGGDAWGLWLRARLRREGVDASLFELVPGVQTPVAIVAVDREGEPSREVYGERIPIPLGDRLEDGIRASAALFIGSSTLVRSEDADMTMRAREVALSLERPVVFAPRSAACSDGARAPTRRPTANACVPGALLVRASAGEAELMTGEDDPERAALALLKAGARMVVHHASAPPTGAILRGELRLRRRRRAGDGGEHDRRRGCSDRDSAGPARDVGVLPGRGGGVAPRGGSAGRRCACERWGALD